jgi:hypothetical protein
MTLRLPQLDEAVTTHLRTLHAEHEKSGEAVARAEQTVAARIVREVWGDTAALLLVEKDIDDDDQTDITTLLVLDKGGTPLWFNPHSNRDCRHYPGAAEVAGPAGWPSLAVHHEVASTIDAHLGAAYDATEGLSWFLDSVSIAHFGYEVNTLILNIDDALNPDALVAARPWLNRPAG